MRPRPIVCALLIAGLMLGLNAGALAQDYPTRQVKIIIAFSPSGAIDILGRFIADKLGKMWGQSVIVENRPGGSGNIGAAAASAAAPDGYTLHFGAQTLAVNVTLSPTTAFDPINSFEPIMLVGTSVEVFQVSAMTPYKSVQRGDRLRQGQSGQAELLLGRHRHDVASLDRAVHGRHRHQDAARALQPDVAGHQRPDVRPHRDQFRPDGKLDRQHPLRQDARAGAERAGALQAVARHSDA